MTITFDRGVDLQSVIDSIHTYGIDFDQTSGPDSALWIDADTGNNPFFLTSPGFQGIAETNISLQYVDTTTYVDASPGTITSEADEVAAGVGHKVILTPCNSLAADAVYNMFILGDSANDNGVSSRTVFDVERGVSVGTTGLMENYSGYTGITDRVIVEITTGGDIGTAKYKWYYSSNGVGSAVLGKVTSRRFRYLDKDDGLQVRFSGSAFVAGDTYEYNVESREILAASFTLQFTTNDGTYALPPVSPSTPALSTPPATVLPTGTYDFYVAEMNPINGSYNVDKNTRQIDITFSDDIDSATITQDTVKVYKYPVSGVYGNKKVVELNKILSVVADVLTIKF
jgi:hypothetical protein